MEVEAVEEFEAIKQLCTLCKNISTPVLEFLSDGKNQEKITSALYKICSFTLFLKDKVIAELWPQAAIVNYNC